MRRHLAYHKSLLSLVKNILKVKWLWLVLFCMLAQGLGQVAYWETRPIQRWCLYCQGHKVLYILIALATAGYAFYPQGQKRWSFLLSLLVAETVWSWAHVAATWGLWDCREFWSGSESCPLQHSLLRVLKGPVGLNALWISISLALVLKRHQKIVRSFLITGKKN